VTSWELTRHAGEVGMAQLPAHASVPRWALADDHNTAFWSVSRTADELSVICAYDAMPGKAQGLGPFVAFSVDGPLDHSLVGVLAGLLQPLAAAGISILAQSTFDTDWILVPAPHADACMRVWSAAGHTIDVEQEEE
jgi:hypothetical protein